MVGSAGDNRDGLDGNETDDGESEEVGFNRAEGEGGLEFAVRPELVVWELFSSPFDFFLHEKKLLHPG